MCFDLKGPIYPPSIGKAIYILFATCDVCSYRFVYFPKSKEIGEYMRDVYLQIKRLGGTMKYVKTDNGGEFCNKEIETFYLEQHMTHETTSPHTPHQNGKAERTNRTVCELAVALMLDAHTPAYLWTYAIKYAVYVLNRFVNKALLLRSTPFIEVHKMVPSVHRLRTFG